MGLQGVQQRGIIEFNSLFYHSISIEEPLAGFPAFPGALTAPVASLLAEDVSGEPGGLGGVLSTISSSRSPLQPPDTDEGEPFTTYFDSKIPIPEDETVSGEKPRWKNPPEAPP